MTYEKFNSNTLINLIIDNDIEGLKSFISEIISNINKNLTIISRNETTLMALEAAGFKEIDQYKKLHEVNRDLRGANSYYSILHDRACAALSKF